MPKKEVILEEVVATEEVVEVVLNQAPVERQDPGNNTRAFRQ